MSRKSRVLAIGTMAAVMFLGASVIGAVTIFKDVGIWGANGGHSVATPARAQVVDLKMAVPDSPTTQGCEPYSDDVTTPVINATLDSDTTRSLFVCLKNVGGSAKQPITVKEIFHVKSDIDTACTGQESAFDTTCGQNLAGEARPLLTPFYGEVDCQSFAPLADLTFLPGAFSEPDSSATLIDNQALAAQRCFKLGVQHTESDELLEQTGQSDTVAFTIEFDALFAAGA